MIIIIITVVILETLLFIAVKQIHYKSLEENLYNQIKISTDLYSKYFSNATLQENILNNVDTFWKQTEAQVQILNLKGEVLMDSIGVPTSNLGEMEDVKKSLEGGYGKWIGNVEYDSEKVMAVSYPLKSRQHTVGVLRFVTSLEKVNQDVLSIFKVFAILGLIVIIIAGTVSIFLSNSIVIPLKEVTKTAEKIAEGNFEVQSKKIADDEIGRLSDTLNYMTKEILKKEQLKNSFITSVSHELRTPLTAIKGWAITLKHGYEDKEILLDGLSIIEKESDRLKHMVEELLDFSKLISGNVELSKKSTNIDDLLKELKQEFIPRSIKEDINLIIKNSVHPSSIMIDQNKLKQILINVMDNAFKFSPTDSSILLESKITDKRLKFIIKDNGCGISPEDLPKVKEKFFKGNTSKSTNGIGLSICEELVKLMNGEIEIASQLGTGTSVVINLPLEEVEDV